MNEEIWKDIIIKQNGVVYDYTGKYQVSNFGRVRSLKCKNEFRMMLMKQKEHKNGYLTINLNKDGSYKTFSVHRLVANAFIPNPSNLPEVNHKNEIKNDNRVDNLEWCTSKYNSNYATRKERQSKTLKEWYREKESPSHKKIICVDCSKVFNSVKAAKEWVGKADISACLNGRQRTAGKHPENGKPLHWMYYEEWLEKNRGLEDKVEFVK